MTADRETPPPLPPDLRDWVPADHLVHFVIDAIGELDVRMARVNEQGSGSVPARRRTSLHRARCVHGTHGAPHRHSGWTDTL